MKVTIWAIVAVATLFHAGQATAAILYTTPGADYTQNFDTLPNNANGQSPNASLGTTGTATYGWRNDFTGSTAGNYSIEGWHLLHPTNATGTAGVDQEGGYNGNQRLRFGTGSSGTGSFYSFGSSSATTERALGMVNSNTMSGTTASSMPMFMGAAIRNNTGGTLTQFTLSYFGEQWRNSANTSQSLLFDYSLDATSVHDTAATRVAVTTLDFTGPVSGGTAGVVAGNTTGRVSIGPVTVTGLNWLPGQDLWIRWGDKNDSGDDHGLAIDDLKFSAIGVPEPASCLMAFVGLLGAAAVRRRRA